MNPVGEKGQPPVIPASSKASPSFDKTKIPPPTEQQLAQAKAIEESTDQMKAGALKEINRILHTEESDPQYKYSIKRNGIEYTYDARELYTFISNNGTACDWGTPPNTLTLAELKSLNEKITTKNPNFDLTLNSIAQNLGDKKRLSDEDRAILGHFYKNFESALSLPKKEQAVTDFLIKASSGELNHNLQQYLENASISDTRKLIHYQQLLQSKNSEICEKDIFSPLKTFLKQFQLKNKLETIEE